MRINLTADRLREYDRVLHGLIFLHILVWHSYDSRVWEEWYEIRWNLRLNVGARYMAGKSQKLQNSCFRVHRYCWLSA